jgi:hypothetical protein
VNIVAGTIAPCGLTGTFRKRSGSEEGNCTIGARALDKAAQSDHLCRAQAKMTSDDETAYQRGERVWPYNHVEESDAMKTIRCVRRRRIASDH